MICLVVFASFLIASAEVPSELQTICKPYIDACSSETSVEDGDLRACSEHFDATACPNTQKANYWECISPTFVRPQMTLATKELEACFYEESKDLETYSFYKTDLEDGLEVSQQIPHTGDGFADLSLTKFYFKNGSSLVTGDSYYIDIFVDTGSLDVNPGYQINYANWRKIPHINLHACLMTDSQTTCSAKFYQDADASTTGNVNVQTSDLFNLNGDEGWHYTRLALTTPGTWRIMGHVYYYTGATCRSGDENCQQSKWDISVSKEVTVADANPPEQEDKDSNAAMDAMCFLSLLFALWQL